MSSAFPVHVERPGPLVEEGEPGGVRRAHRALRAVDLVEHRRVQRAGEQVGRHEVGPPVPHPRRSGDRVHHTLDTRTHPLRRRASPGAGSRIGGTGEVEQMRALGVVELQSPGQRVEHALRRSLQVAALQARVVLDGHARQLGHLGPAQARHPTTADGGQAGLLGRDPGPPRRQELAHLAPVVHAGHATTAVRDRGSPCRYPRPRRRAALLAGAIDSARWPLPLRGRRPRYRPRTSVITAAPSAGR
jgi:hypothetical protein